MVEQLQVRSSYLTSSCLADGLLSFLSYGERELDILRGLQHSAVLLGTKLLRLGMSALLKSDREEAQCRYEKHHPARFAHRIFRCMYLLWHEGYTHLSLRPNKYEVVLAGCHCSQAELVLLTPSSFERDMRLVLHCP